MTIENSEEKMRRFASDSHPIFAEDAIRNMTEANKKTDLLSTLAITIAFSISGLSLNAIESANKEIIQWSIVLLVLSIVCGGVQMMLDHKYYTKQAEINRNISTIFFSIKHNIENMQEEHSKISKEFEKWKSHSEKANNHFLYLQILLVTIGSLMSLSQFIF